MAAQVFADSTLPTGRMSPNRRVICYGYGAPGISPRASKKDQFECGPAFATCCFLRQPPSACSPPASAPLKLPTTSRTETDAHSLLGSYLAANVAKGANDNNSAAAFYRSALALDPNNVVLLEQAFQTEAAEAHWDRAVPLARELVAKSSENRMAYLLLGINSFKNGNYMQADEEFRKASDGPIGELTAALARAWAAAASGNRAARHEAARHAQAGRMGAVLSQLSQGADRRRHGPPAGGAGRLRALHAPGCHDAAHRARLRPSRGAQRQRQAGQGNPRRPDRALAGRAARAGARAARGDRPGQENRSADLDRRPKAWPRCSTASAKR